MVFCHKRKEGYVCCLYFCWQISWVQNSDHQIFSDFEKFRNISVILKLVYKVARKFRWKRLILFNFFSEGIIQISEFSSTDSRSLRKEIIRTSVLRNWRYVFGYSEDYWYGQEIRNPSYMNTRSDGNNLGICFFLYLKIPGQQHFMLLITRFVILRYIFFCFWIVIEITDL